MSFKFKRLGIAYLLITAAVLCPSALSQAVTATGIANTQCDIKLVLGTPGINHPPVPPAGRIRIMPTRYGDLEKTIIGYEKTHLPLVKYDGGVFGPAGAADDLGSFYLIPQIAVRLGLPLRRSIDLFYITVLLAALGIGILGCLIALRTNIAKIWAITELVLVTALAYSLGDVYILLAAVAMSVVPLALYVSNTPKLTITVPLMFGSGLAISIANSIRGHSGTGVLLFLFCLVSTRFIGSSYRKAAIVLLLLCGLVLPSLYLRHLIQERNNFLRSVCPDYPTVLPAHAFWHSAYIGFGYLSNEVVTSYNDQVAYDKVQSLVPGTLYESPEYQHILRRQVWLLVRQHPQLVLYTLAAKLGVICSMFLVFANVGLIAAKRVRKPLGLELPFWIGIVFNALFGILVIPSVAYLLGFITFATLYGAVSVDCALCDKLSTSPVSKLLRVELASPRVGHSA